MDDFLRIIDHVIGKRPKHKHMNVTPTESIDLISLARIINEASDHKSEITILNEGMNTEYSGDNSRLLKEIPGFRFTKYRKSVDSLYGYYKSQIDSIDKKAIREDPYLRHCKAQKPL